MPEAVLKRATEPFFTTKERGHGTGLGLSMVAGFAKQSGGKMKIQSEEGKGTTIEIHLPLMKAKSKPEVPVAVRPPQANSVGKRGILIVDDEPALRELAQEWAKAEGHDVLVANSADEALTLLQAKAFDILVTDIIMPGEIDGLGLAEEASERYPAMNILLMSGYSKDTATNRADVQWPLLVKPFSRLEFYAALKELETTDFGQLA
jgi:CheY-like chemotaxis protein